MCSSSDEWMWYIDTIKYYSALKGRTFDTRYNIDELLEDIM